MSLDLDSSTQFSNYQQKILTLTRENEELKAEMEKRDILSEKSEKRSADKVKDRVNPSEKSEVRANHFGEAIENLG